MIVGGGLLNESFRLKYKDLSELSNIGNAVLERKTVSKGEWDGKLKN